MAKTIRSKPLENMEPLEIGVENKLEFSLGLSKMPCACLCYLYFLSSMWFLVCCAILALT